ncbi:hypothetical protein HDF18_12890 [Mucilaginibacter sp. X5P1]|uniref:hypothetical protein n=1 Tax=Mucilaginibacter sp. X5P1 TaxID=2723088 RepID=UPI0016199500|nr:hypothetical protein [Mucilaginibacter sp. X5P1]MBB6141834.1 hypothetical protein [Mucilaginibacter sp. X5P1]
MASVRVSKDEMAYSVVTLSQPSLITRVSLPSLEIRANSTGNSGPSTSQFSLDIERSRGSQHNDPQAMIATFILKHSEKISNSLLCADLVHLA